MHESIRRLIQVWWSSVTELCCCEQYLSQQSDCVSKGSMEGNMEATIVVSTFGL